MWSFPRPIRCVAVSHSARVRSKSTWFERRRSRDEDDPSDRLAALDVVVRRGGFSQREGAVDHDAEIASNDLIDEARDHLLRSFGRDLGTEVHAGERLVAGGEHRDIKWLGVAAGAADRDHSTAVAQ